MRLCGSFCLVLAACGFNTNAPAIDAAVDSPPAPDAPLGAPSLTPEVHDFGLVDLGATAPDVTFTVNAKAATPVLAVAITGTLATDHTILNDGCTGTALAELASCTVLVRYRAVTPGNTMAVLRVTAAGIDLTSMLRGHGFVPSDLIFDSTPSPFGTLGVGFTSAPQTITVRNPGTLATPVIAVTKTGPDTADFAISTDTCNGAAIAATSTCSFTLSFAPNTVGAKSATIVVGPSTGTISSVVTGTAQALTIATVPVDFGSVVIGATSTATTLTVTNVAANSVGPLVTSLAGNHPGDFVFGANACNGLTLLPAQACTIDVAFKPTLSGLRNGLVRLMVGSTILADGIVQGVGLAPDPIMISPTSFAFPPTAVTQTSAAQTFTVFNTGVAPTGLLASALTGTDPTQFAITTDTCTGADVPAGGMCSIDVVFKPTTTGAKVAVLEVTSTVAGTITAGLTGTGT